uniref:Putative effector protein n=1 Tax=Heterodera avenae TaxID=34510 RepID=A0A2L0VDN0_HETAV|nr:putative effector protein [Heterodera avenae]
MSVCHLSIFVTLCLLGCSVSSAFGDDDDLFEIGSAQSVAVTGILTCDGTPSVGTKVKLYDVDTFDPDDLMAEGFTDERGHFLLKGYETEISDIDPKLNIYHKCNDEHKLCLLKFSIEIPDSYISEGKRPQKIFDIGKLNLEGKFSGQTRDCIN